MQDLTGLVKYISSLKPSSQSEALIDRKLRMAGFSAGGMASPGKFLDALKSAGLNKVFSELPVDEKKNFFANMRHEKSHPAYAEMEAMSEMMAGPAPAGAGTTSANVGAFPVPLGQESPGRKKKHESVSKLMGVGAYQISEVVDADDELKEFE